MSGSDPSTDPKPYANVTVAADPTIELVFDGMEAVETLGRPFLYNLDVSSSLTTSDMMNLLGSKVTVTFTTTSGTERYFNGMLTRMIYAGLSGGATRYHLELRPWIWMLTRIHDCKIFQNMAPFDIITQVCRDAGFSDFADKRQNQAGSTVLDYCVQYRESSLDFVTRLMEQYGIYYYFEHTDTKHTLNFADDPNSHTALTNAIQYQRRMTEMRTVADHVWEFAADLRVQPGTYTYRDYNFTTPSADLTAKSMKQGAHEFGSSEIYDYPGIYDTAANGQKLTDVRIQEIAARRQMFTGSTNARALVCGCRFNLSKAANDPLKNVVDESIYAEYLVIGTITHFGMGESKSGSSNDKGELTDSYSCSFQAIPGTTPFRLERQTNVPLIRGPQTAKVVGPSGQEIYTDQYGRVKVQFYWDRVNPPDETASCWIRVSQTWAGAGWGSTIIPRIGQEVIVAFLEGNPDRPIITGCVYNANNTVPYPLPDNATRSTIKSNSSLGGGGSNELRFEDKKGSEEVMFHAQYDYNKFVLNNETVTITQDHTTTVQQGNRAITVSQGNNSLTVSQGNNSATISTGNDSLTVSSGNHSITVSAGSSSVTAAQSITLQVGGNSIKIDTSGVTITATQVSVQAQASLSAQGASVSVNAQADMSLQAGGPLSVQGAMVSIN
jgi:type VI secretion system secreted protein VgrG